MENTNIRYSASNKTTIAHAYDISLHILRKWLKSIEAEIGDYVGFIYTPKQVAIIVEHFGEPVNITLIRCKQK